MCSLKIVFKSFRGKLGKVTGEVIATETGQTPMIWCENYTAELDMKRIEFWRAQRLNMSNYEKVQSDFFSFSSCVRTVTDSA